jgi:hypothetical protein
MPKLIQSLPPGPLAIIGDVHGEIDALLALLHRLGVDPERRRAQRPVVFVGDLVDRGPDSVAVVEVVSRLVDAGLAYAVLGNHELNLLQNDHKEGNGWFWGDAEDYAQLDTGSVRFASRLASPSDRERVTAFARELPLVLVRDDLRVVHACWDPQAAGQLPEAGEHAALAEGFAATIDADLVAKGVPERAKEERAAFAGLRVREVEPNRHLAAVVEEDTAHQLRNPVRLLTSGGEVEVPVGRHFFKAGKWRFVQRDRWWRNGADRPTVVGHYWRRRVTPTRGDLELWDLTPPFQWDEGVFCVDYSVGYRYKERARGRVVDFHGGLAAMCWPERVLVFDDRDGAPIATR